MLLGTGFWALVLGLVVWTVVRYWYYVLLSFGLISALAVGLLVLKIYLEQRKERERLAAQEQEVRARREAFEAEQARRAQILSDQHAVLHALARQNTRLAAKIQETAAGPYTFAQLAKLTEKIDKTLAKIQEKTTRPPFASTLPPQSARQVRQLVAAVEESREEVENLRARLEEDLARPHVYIPRLIDAKPAPLVELYALYFETGILLDLESKETSEAVVVEARVAKKNYLRTYGAEFLDALILSLHLTVSRQFPEVITASVVNIYVDYIDESTGNDGVKCVATSRAGREFIRQIKPARVNPRKALAKCETKRLSKFEILAPNDTAVVPELTLRGR